MKFHVVNNEILVPLKCGSTYLEKIYPDNIVDINYCDLPNLKGISTIIIREPIEHLQSALHTEILMWYAQNPSESLSVDTATPIIKRFINVDSNLLPTPHWDVNYYEHLYKFWKRSKGSIKIVHTSDLTQFIKEKYKIDNPHDKFSYGIPAHRGEFKYAYTTKQELAKWIEKTLPELWDELVKEIPKANKFYNLIINGEVSELYELEERIQLLEIELNQLEIKLKKLETGIKFKKTLI